MQKEGRTQSGRSTIPVDNPGEILIGDGRSPLHSRGRLLRHPLRYQQGKAAAPWQDVLQLSPNPGRLPNSMPGSFHGRRPVLRGNVPSNYTVPQYSRLTVHNLDPVASLDSQEPRPLRVSKALEQACLRELSDLGIGMACGCLSFQLPRLVASQGPRLEVFRLGDDQKKHSHLGDAKADQAGCKASRGLAYSRRQTACMGAAHVVTQTPRPLLHRNASPPRSTCYQPDEGGCGILGLGSGPPRKPMMTSVLMPAVPPPTTRSFVVVLSSFSPSNPDRCQRTRSN